MTTMCWVGRVWYAWALRLLPAWLRDQAGHDMEHAFDERQRHAHERGGILSVFRVWMHEGVGLIHTAYRSRRPDTWTRRTRAPEKPDSSYQGPTMDSVRSDLRFAFRTFARRPGMTLLAVLTLALGIGSSTAMFTVVDSVLLRPLAYPKPDEIMRVYPTWPDLMGHPTMRDLAERGTWSWPEFWLVHEQQSSFQYLAAYAEREATLSSEGTHPEVVQIGVASRDLFPLLGADVAMGRLFDETDGDGGTPAVVLSYDTWKDRYAGDPNVLGTTIRIDDSPRTVIGVLAQGFSVTGVDAAMWVPRRGTSTDAGIDNHSATRALGRLAPGASKERAREEVARILGTLPAEHGKHGARVEPFQTELTRRVRPVLLIMLAAAGLLLLVACGNVAALLLGAGIDRERELSVRGAVGATRGRLTQQLLTENLALTLTASLGGIGLAGLTTRALTLLAPPGIPRLGAVGVDRTVLLFAVGLAVACGLVFGLIPALSLSQTELAGSMGSLRTTAGRRTRLQSAVVVGELTLATLLLVGATLLGRTVSALDRVDPGFNAGRMIAVSVAFPYGRFGSDDDADAADAYETRMEEGVRSLPGVAGLVSTLAPPFFGWTANNDVLPEGWSEPGNGPNAERRFVSEGYFRFMGIPLVEGRDLERADFGDGAEAVVVVSQGLAELAWPGRSALGRTLRYWGRTARVIGVAADVHDRELEGATPLAFYAPITGGARRGAPLLIRTVGDPAALIPGIRDRIWSVHPDLPITRIATMDELMSDQLTDQVFRARLMSVFAFLAGVFALLGVYGVTAGSVARRTREMGLRVALGAGKGSVHGLVTGQAVRLALYGAAGGLVGSIVLGRAIESFLWGVTHTDPVTLTLVGVGLILLAALAALPPALRATRVDPIEVLRAE